MRVTSHDNYKQWFDVATSPIGGTHMHRLQTSDKVIAPDDHKLQIISSPMWSPHLVCYSPDILSGSRSLAL